MEFVWEHKRANLALGGGFVFGVRDKADGSHFACLLSVLEINISINFFCALIARLIY